MNIIEKLKIEARKINLKILREEIENSWVEEKIENHLKRNPHIKLDKEEIKNKIMEDDLIASFFAKDPAKQNISEKYFAKVIKNIDGVSNFENLPSNTKVFVKNGEIMQDEKRAIGIKSIDYSFYFKDALFICSQKYTKDRGGAQDNQFNDVVSFLVNSRELKDAIPMALVDGNYYTENKKEELKLINSKAIVCSVFDLEEILNERY